MIVVETLFDSLVAKVHVLGLELYACVNPSTVTVLSSEQVLQASFRYTQSFNESSHKLFFFRQDLSQEQSL